MQRRRLVLVALGAGLAGMVLASWLRVPTGLAQETSGPDTAAVERARDTVKLIDAMYKNYVVEITATYVGEKKQPPAARVTKRVFNAMHKGGFHTARLVDATGEPINEDNRPNTPFEKKAVGLIKAGKGYYDEVTVNDGKGVLRAATVVPVVMKQCITCHPGYKEGDVLGALVYEVPIK
jgi:Protein of unknown function (DUF3365)